MKDATSQLGTATRRAKSDVANKLISMFLHELSRKVSREWGLRVESEQYGELVRARFGNLCPYCLRSLAEATPAIEHLDGMNRYRVGLHVPGNVLVSCRKCNSEKRRDDSKKTLTLASSGWASFLSHDGDHCPAQCATCKYWRSIWPDQAVRRASLESNLQRIADFRREFSEFEKTMGPLLQTLPEVLAKMYVDCQVFAETEIATMLSRF